ncbi:MAG TPA: glycosyltransferase family 39 protein [Candidatus Angelobacter sp.]|nr:glycosyltransferase family 39 protein [Candidatus Angelobacter sp.]
MTPTSSRFRLPAALQVYSVIFISILALHAPLLRLPFFWDEAGFYVPAAYDLVHSHSLIPKTTLDTSHPPLSAAYLALWFSLSGWKPAVARVAMLLVAAFALTNVFLLARRLAGTGVAFASTVATAVYPIFFVQSSLTHADLSAAALTLWGIRTAIEKRLWTSQLAFSLAVLAKETAIITPLALAGWEWFADRSGSSKRRIGRTAVWFTPLVPLLLWLFYHYEQTGRLFGGTEFFQYNVTHAISPLRFLLALAMRLWHLLGVMNMLALTGAMAVAMRFPAVVDEEGERKRIDIPVQLQFALIMLAYVLTFSLVGGALLTRYLLPVYPLVIMIAMSTLHRRIQRWEWPAAVIVIFFVLGLFFDPPYRFAPEDNLTYRDFVQLHATAARFLEQHEQGATVLAAWPAKDEISKPYLGYVNRPFEILPAADYTLEELYRARERRGQYQAAYLFSTKYESGVWFRSPLWNRLNRRFFDYHQDVPPETAAEILGGRIVFLARRKAEWVAIVEMEQHPELALTATHPQASPSP